MDTSDPIRWRTPETYSASDEVKGNGDDRSLRKSPSVGCRRSRNIRITESSVIFGTYQSGHQQSRRL